MQLEEPLVAGAVGLVRRRLLPFLLVLYVSAWIDRVNVGFAALQMNADLALSAEVFGLGSGIFFIGYCLFEIPSNFILHRVGARIWLGRIMISWGLVAASMMFVRTDTAFYVLRFLLGVAEAGFFPGVVYYLSYWFPEAERARAIATFMMAIPVAGLIGGPLSGALLGLDGVWGLRGWQWLFLIEGMPTVLLGIAVIRYLPDRPTDARWLPAPEKAALDRFIAEEQCRTRDRHAIGTRAALLNPTVWHLGSIFLLANVSFYAYSIWSPQIIKSLTGSDNLTVGLISGVISAIVIVAMRWNSAHSDRTGERRMHVAIPILLMGVGSAVAALLESSPAAIAALALVPIGIGAAYGPFWSMPSAFLAGEAAAAGIALVAVFANLSGFIGPAMLGWLKGRSESYSLGLWVLAMAAGAAALITLLLSRARGRTHER